MSSTLLKRGENGQLFVDDTPPVSRWSYDDITSSRHKGNAQSEAAHDAIRETKEDQRARVLAYIASRGPWGATWDECCVALRINPQCSGRITELLASGQIEPAGRTRPTRGGCSARVVIARSER